MMSALEAIITRPGVIGISDTNRTDKTGRWNVLVTENTFKSTRKVLTSKLLEWVNNLPDKMLEEIPSEFPEPQVHQKNAYAGDDDSSSGKASYMSSCAQSYGSFNDNIVDAPYFHPPGRSSASALAGTNDPHIPLTERIKEVLVIPKASTTELPADVTIASLQAKIKNLCQLLLGAQTPSTVTETSGPEPGDTAARMSIIESNMELMTHQFTLWMTEMRQTVTTPREPNLQITQHAAQDHYMDPMLGTICPQNDLPSAATPTRQHAKRTDTRTSPRCDYMDTDLSDTHLEQPQDALQTFPRSPPSPVQPDPLTQPASPIVHRGQDGKRPRSSNPSENSPTIDSPPLSPFQDMATLLAAQASPPTPPGYHHDNPQYVYEYNPDGSLFCVGLAQPADFFPDGTIRGPQPTHDQSDALRQIFYGPLQLPLDPSPLLLPGPSSHPEDMITETILSSTSITTLTTQRQPSPTPTEQTTGTDSHLSLLAEGATIVHA
jgi:hypothetical protein